jgi:hypothetical protein
MNQHSPKLAEPHFRIGVGQKHGFFTLQEWHQEPIYKVDYRGTRLAGIEWKSSHIVNLSQDYQEALIKAKRLAHMHSMTLRASESKEETLDAIARRDRESIAADNLREAQKLDSKLFTRRNITSPVFGFGKHQGNSIYDVIAYDREYLEWFSAQSDDLLALRIQVLLERTPAAPKLVSSHFGLVGDRVEIEGTVKMVRGIESAFGFSTMYKIQAANGNIFVTYYSGTKIDWKEGEVVNIVATIKKHDEYQDEKQTIITRAKEI